jgi:hypothetical protein
MHGISLAFAMSSLCLVLSHRSTWMDRLEQWKGRPGVLSLMMLGLPVDNPFSNMTLSVIKSIKNSSTTFSTTELVRHTSSGQLARV